jgi:hypothetical protein
MKLLQGELSNHFNLLVAQGNDSDGDREDNNPLRKLTSVWLVANIQHAKTMAVAGSVIAQYTQNWLVMTPDSSQCSDGRAKRVAKNVPGRKTIVMTAMVFIEELSCFAACAN